MDRKHRVVPRMLVVTAVVAGAALGSYAIAAAASGGSGSTRTSPPTATAAPSQAPNAQHPWGRQRSDETLLTGDTASKVRQLALVKVGSGATVVRVETDADGHAAYEAHMVETDGTPVTVYVDKAFDIVSVETMPMR